MTTAERASAGSNELARSTAFLTFALGVAGVLTYVFFALCSHFLSPADYGLIVVLWSTMFVLISVLFRPVEQLLSRSIAEAQATGLEASRALQVAARIQISVALSFTIGAFVLRDFLVDELFTGESFLYWCLIVSVLGFALTLYIRGALAGSGRIRLFGALVVADAVARLIASLAVAVGIATGADPIALGIALAPFASGVVVIPLARRQLEARKGWAARASRSTRPQHIQPSPDLSVAEGGVFAGAVMVVMVADQIFLSSAVLVARALEGVVVSGFVFNLFVLARAPVLLFQAAATTLLPHLTREGASSKVSRSESLNPSVLTTLKLIAGFTTLTALVMLIIGPAAMQAAFGSNFDYPRLDITIVVLGMGLYLAATTLNQGVLARGHAWRAAASWSASAIVLIGWSLVPVLGTVRRVEVGFAGASLMLLLTLLFAYLRAPTPTR